MFCDKIGSINMNGVLIMQENSETKEQEIQYRYGYEEHSHETQEGVPYRGFDIVAFCGQRLVYRAENVFTAKSVAEQFVNRCNAEWLELCYLADVLEDRLCVLPL